MYALELNRRIAVEDSLESLAASPARSAAPRLEKALAPAWWLAAAVIVTAALKLGGTAASEAFAALAGTAALVYLGTAMVSGQLKTAALDLTAATVTAGLAIGGAAPATVLIAHALWGALRSSLTAAGPQRQFPVGWSIFFAASALFASLGA
jgi:hypothetical protein